MSEKDLENRLPSIALSKELVEDNGLALVSTADHPQNPINWSRTRKWLLTGFACFMCFILGLNALSISSAATVINERFGISDASFPNSYWTVTAWNVGASIAPLVGLPLMENFGVRPTYLTCYALFIAFVIPQAVAENYATLIVSRFFAGGFGSIVQNGVANVIGDMWVCEQNTVPTIFFTYAYLMGFTLGPTIASAIIQFLDWRWIFYVQLIIYVPLFPISWFLVKETRATIILKKGPEIPMKCGSECSEKPPTFLQLLYDGTTRPALLFFTEPVIFFMTLWSGLSVGNVFLASQSIAQIYGANYGFGDIQAGYVEASLGVGQTIGLALSIWQHHIHLNSGKNNKENPGILIPESFLELSIPVSFVGLAGGLFMYGWTSYPFVPWIAPTIALGLVGVGIMTVVNAVLTYTTDAYGRYAGSAVAAYASVENLISGFVPLATSKLYGNLGFHWASSLLGFFALALSFAPVVLYIKGPKIRERSKFMNSL